MLNSYEISVCKQQASLFSRIVELTGKDPKDFIEKFMVSKTAEYMDLEGDMTQWMMEAYLAEEFLKEGIDIKNYDGETQYDSDTLYWIGYLYRYWGFYRNPIKQSDIYKLADFDFLYRAYPGLHVESLENVILEIAKINLEKSNI